MTNSTAPGTARPEATGITAEAMRLFASLGRHIQGLVTLAGLEGREAVALYLRLAILLGATLFLAAFGYVFLLLFAAFAIEGLLHVSWLWISLGFALLHLIGAAICALVAKNKFRTPVFQATSEEVRKDFAALRNQTPSAP